MRSLLILSIAFLLMLVTAVPAWCCTIPVFRYALDRWPAENYSVAVPGDLSMAMIERFDLLKEQSANLDFQSTSEDTFSLFAPWSNASIWSGETDAFVVDNLADSPGRQELIRRILAGDSIVWVYVSQGTDDDQKKIERLKKRLVHVESIAGLPDMDPLDPTSQLGPGPPLKLHFSLIVVNSKDDREKWFIRFLAGQRAGLVDEPMSFVAPVYGRGRVLDAIAAEQLKEVMVDDVTSYLIAPCSCNVKSQNPGWDLLLDVDWAKELQNVASGGGRADSGQRQEPSQLAMSTELGKISDSIDLEQATEIDQVVYSPSGSSIDEPRSIFGTITIMLVVFLGAFVLLMIRWMRRT